MKIVIDYDSELSENEVYIKGKSKNDAQITELLKYLDRINITVIGIKNNKTFFLSVYDIYYIECVEDKTFIYLKDSVYESKMRLYEFEDILRDAPFVRTAKSLILNTDKIRCVRSLLNGKLEATLLNGEKVLINRHYVADFKKKIIL